MRVEIIGTNIILLKNSYITHSKWQYPNTFEDLDKSLIFTNHLYVVYKNMIKSRGLSKFSIIYVIVSLKSHI